MPTYAEKSKIGKIRMKNNVYIQRVYNKGNVLFVYTNPVIYHIDDSTNIQKVTKDVEYGTSCRTAYTAGTPSGWNTAWKFTGWRTDTTPSGDIFTSTRDKIMGHDTVNLYAVYGKTITLSFAAGGGSGSMNPQTATQYYNNGKYNGGNENGVTFTLPQNTVFKKDGYSFIGWSVGGVTKQPGDSVTVYSTATATALWKQNTYTTTSVDVLTYGDGTDILPEGEFKAESTHVLVAQNVDLSSYTNMQIYMLKFVTDHEVMENNDNKGTYLRVYLKNANTSTMIMEVNTTTEDYLHGEPDDRWAFIGTAANNGLKNISSYNGTYSIYCCTYMANGQCEVLGVKFTFS